jgi:hypothetical protein
MQVRRSDVRSEKSRSGTRPGQQVGTRDSGQRTVNHLQVRLGIRDKCRAVGGKLTLGKSKVQESGCR